MSQTSLTVIRDLYGTWQPGASPHGSGSPGRGDERIWGYSFPRVLGGAVSACSARGRRGCRLLKTVRPCCGWPVWVQSARRLRHGELEVRSAARHDERGITGVDSLHGQVRKHQGDVVAVRLDHRFVERKAEFTGPSVGFG